MTLLQAEELHLVQRTLKLQMQVLGQSDMPFILLLDTEGRERWAETMRAIKDMVLRYSTATYHCQVLSNTLTRAHVSGQKPIISLEELQAIKA